MKIFKIICTKYLNFITEIYKRYLNANYLLIDIITLQNTKSYRIEIEIIDKSLNGELILEENLASDL